MYVKVCKCRCKRLVVESKERKGGAENTRLKRSNLSCKKRNGIRRVMDGKTENQAKNGQRMQAKSG